MVTTRVGKARKRAGLSRWIHREMVRETKPAEGFLINVDGLSPHTIPICGNDN